MEYGKEARNSKTNESAIFCNLKISKFYNGIIEKKISAALEYAASSSIYSKKCTIEELTTSQSVVLIFLYGLFTEDIGLTAVIGEESNNVEQMKSTYLKVWLKDDFTFEKKDVVKGMSFLRKLLDYGSLDVPQHLMDIVAPLRAKYDVRVRRNGIVRLPSTISIVIKRNSSTNKVVKRKLIGRFKKLSLAIS